MFNITNIISIVGAVVSALAAMFSFLLFQQAEQLERKQFPAKLIVSHVTLYRGEDDVTTFVPGATIEGLAVITNIGRARAQFYPFHGAARYKVDWGKPNLPMVRQFIKEGSYTDIDIDNWMTRPDRRTGDGSPGDVLIVKFHTTVPLAYRHDMVLYFMGWVQYKDEASGGLFITFARCFDASLGRFVPVDNPDYENEDEKDVGERRTCTPS